MSRLEATPDKTSSTTTATESTGSVFSPRSLIAMAGAVITMIYGAKGPLLTSAKQALAATTTFTYEPTFNRVTSRQSPEIDGYGGATVPFISQPSSVVPCGAVFPSQRA